jgi:hypothetical protein
VSHPSSCCCQEGGQFYTSTQQQQKYEDADLEEIFSFLLKNVFHSLLLSCCLCKEEDAFNVGSMFVTNIDFWSWRRVVKPAT